MNWGGNGWRDGILFQGKRIFPFVEVDNDETSCEARLVGKRFPNRHRKIGF